ncbi:hypothetical protein V8F06_011306 [Rhypophila decipiens]
MATTSRANTVSTTISQADTLHHPTASGASPPKPESEFETFLRTFKHEAEINKKTMQDWEKTTVDHVKAVIDAIQQKHMSNKRQQYMKRLEVFVVNMESFGKVIEVFLNSTDYLAFVWGPMKFMLMTACSYTEAFNSLLDAYLQIGELLPQLEYHQQHCISNSYMRTVLSLMYKDILEFHAAALKHFRKPMWKKLFVAVWSGFLVKLREIMQKMERHKHLIESQASIVQFEEAQRFRETVEANFREIREQFVRHKWPDQLNCARAKSDSPGSGQWLLKHGQFKDWYDPVYCLKPLLWLNGIPGAGKTTLTSTVIDSLPTLCDPTPICLAYFYCKDGDPNRNSFVAIARGLLSQLLRGNPDLLLQLYDKGNLKSGEAILSDAQTAKELLEVALDSSVKPTYIIIDGIDECQDRQERKLITSWFSEQVNNLPREDFGDLRCLFVSRKDGPAIKDLGMLPSIELRPVDTRDDIRNYLTAWGRKIEEKYGAVDSKAYPLVDTIMAATQGMFLFAKLAVLFLYDLDTREQLLKNVHPGHFPDEIGKMYDRILARIFKDDAPPPKQKAISRLLSLLVCARRPLRWYEIQGFFAFDPDDENQPVDHEGRKLRDDPTELCLSLVEWHPDNSVQLVHPTARDHLVRNGAYVAEHLAEHEITEQVLAFLNSPGMDHESLKMADIRDLVRKGYYSFLDYSVAYWPMHLQAIAAARSKLDGTKFEELTDLVSVFIDSHRMKRNDEAEAQTSSTMAGKLEPFSQLDCFPKLVQAVNYARKQLSLHGKGPSADEVLNLWQVTMSIRTIQEQLAGNQEEMNTLGAFYGSNHFKCPRVNCIRFHEGYSSADDRDRHVNKHERPFSCGIPDCFMAMVGYSTERALQKHLFELHGLNPGANVEFPSPPKDGPGTKQKAEGVFKCSECPRRFTRKFNLTNHMRTHQNSKPFACRFATCGKRFTRSDDRVRHEAIHEIGEGRKTFVCFGVLDNGTTWGCKKSFKRADKLRAHFNNQIGRQCRAPWLSNQERTAHGPSESGPQPLATNENHVVRQETDIEMSDAEWQKLLESMVELGEADSDMDWDQK